MKIKTEKKPVTWEDIENSINDNNNNKPDETDEEKLAYFKSKIIAHLDKLQLEEDKKIISFPIKN